MRAMLLLLLACAVAPAQGSFRIPFSATLKTYLGLSDDQVAKIEASNSELRTRIDARQERLFRLSVEVRQELAKPSPDPMAVGIRRAEMENACREERRLSDSTRERNLALLTDAQKAKLRSLAEAARMMSVVQEASAANLFSGFGTSGDFASLLVGGGFGIGGGLPFPVSLAIPGIAPACGALELRGDFRFPGLR